jgi:hypothetical protein
MHDNQTFCRLLLKEAHELVRKRDPQIKLRKAWIWHSGRSWEFHAPDGFYWHGRADNAFDARYKGWMAWLEQVEIVS